MTTRLRKGRASRAGVMAVLVMVVGCQRTPEASTAPAASATLPVPSAIVAADVDATVAPQAAPSETDAARTILDKWNDAHTRHDTAALAALYAPRVLFYPTEEAHARLSAAECVRRKAAAFAKASDYSQALRNVELYPDGSGGVYVTLSKVSTVHGKSTTYEGYVYIDDGHIIAEGDGSNAPTVRWNWCTLSTPMSSVSKVDIAQPEAIGGFKVSPVDALRGAVRSQHAAELRAKGHHARLKAYVIVAPFGCPQLCNNFNPSSDCENKAGEYSVGFYDPLRPEDDPIEEVKVDAMSYVLRWSPHGSEPLPR